MYDLEQVKRIICETIENRGIDYTEDDSLLDLDSLQFISMVVELEEALNITIDDDYLSADRFSSFLAIQNTISDILEHSV